MATVKTVFPATARMPAPLTGHAPLTVLSGGAAAPHTPILAFDAATAEEAQFVGQAAAYGSGNWTIRLRYAMASATTGDVKWNAQLRALTPGDAQIISSDAFGTANTATDTVPGTAGHMKEVAITLSNLDSVAADDYYTLRVVRDAADAGDTATGDARLVSVTVEYSDI